MSTGKSWFDESEEFEISEKSEPSKKVKDTTDKKPKKVKENSVETEKPKTSKKVKDDSVNSDKKEIDKEKLRVELMKMETIHKDNLRTLLELINGLKNFLKKLGLPDLCRNFISVDGCKISGCQFYHPNKDRKIHDELYSALKSIYMIQMKISESLRLVDDLSDGVKEELTGENKILCRFLNACAKVNCPFIHPSELEDQTLNDLIVEKDELVEKLNRDMKKLSMTLLCRSVFNSYSCSKKDCTFNHSLCRSKKNLDNMLDEVDTFFQWEESYLETCHLIADGTKKIDNKRKLLGKREICMYNLGCTNTSCKYKHYCV